MPERKEPRGQGIEGIAAEMKVSVINTTMPVSVGRDVALISPALADYFNRVGYTTDAKSAMEEALRDDFEIVQKALARLSRTRGYDPNILSELERLEKISGFRIYAVRSSAYAIVQKYDIQNSPWVVVRRT